MAIMNGKYITEYLEHSKHTIMFTIFVVRIMDKYLQEWSLPWECNENPSKVEQAW